MSRQIPITSAAPAMNIAPTTKPAASALIRTLRASFGLSEDKAVSFSSARPVRLRHVKRGESSWAFLRSPRHSGLPYRWHTTE
jgi:hypothetical protein